MSPVSQWKRNCANTQPPECMKSKKCASDKHHYDECVERVTKAQESDEPSKENCVEECMSPYIYDIFDSGDDS